nr:MAG TPA: tail protein [Caudoviricetes sp.]
MINVSDEFKQLMTERQDFKCNAEVTLANGTVLPLGEDDFSIDNNSLVDAAGANTIPLGVALSRNVQLEIMNDDDHLSNYDFFGAKIRLYLTFELSETTEKIEYGTFTVTQPETYGSVVTIVGYDDMYKADKAYSTALTFPATAKSVLIDSCDTCGILIGDSNFLHNDFQIPTMPSSEYTHRQIIGFIAMIACGNARIDRTGRLQIMTYDFDYDNENIHKLVDYNNLTSDTNDVQVTGVRTTQKVTTTDDGNTSDTEKTVQVGKDGYVLSVENPLVTGHEETLISWIYEKFENVTFRAFTMDYISYPIAEFMDKIKVTDWRENSFYSVLTDVNFVFFGYTTLKNSAESPLRNQSNYTSSNQKAIIQGKQLVEQERNNRQNALDKMQEALKNSNGMYSTQEVLLDGSTIYYLHDKPTMKESKNVIKLTAEVIGFSIDGGKTYPYGFTITGEMVARLLYTEGINADYINTGALTVKDKSGNIIFYADMETGTVKISGDNVTIGGKTAPEAISDAVKESKNYADGKVSDFAETVTKSVSDLQNQIDGQIETFYYDYEPNLKNIPASDWTTEDDKKKHEGDLFYWKSKGYAYRFFKDGDTWKWQLVQDTDVTKALQTASFAQSTANSKCRVFLTQPTPPYDTGDMWNQGQNGDILTCVVARADGASYVETDWQKLNKYTDDETANKALEEARKSRAMIINLDNDYQAITTDYKGEYTSFPECHTTAQVLYGHTDISNDCTYNVQKSGGVVGSWNNSTHTYTVTALTTDVGWVDITANYLNTYSVTKRFDIAKLKGGIPGETGAKGDKGETGASGRSITGSETTYQASSSGTTAPTGTWSKTPPSVAENQYLWTRTIYTYSDKTTSTTYSIGKMGAKGEQGAKGETGATGPQGPQGEKGVAGKDGTDGKNATYITVSGTNYDAVKGISNNASYLLINGTKYNFNVGRGHTLAVINPSNGNVESIKTYDTCTTASALDSPLSAVASGKIICLFTADASGLTQTARNTLIECGSAMTDTWGSSRVTHLFIGMKGLEKGNAYEIIAKGSDATKSITAYYTASGIVLNGQVGATGPQGAKGNDGVSPTVSISKSGTVTTITITDKNGTHTQTVNDGTNGTAGKAGADGKTPYFHVKYSNDGGKTFTSNSGEDVGTYIGTCTDYNQADPTTVGSYTWARIKGESGATGAKGETGATGPQGPQGNIGPTGNGIKSTAITYQVSSSGTAVPTGTWSGSVPSTSAGQYLWTRTITTYTNNTTTTSYSVSRNGSNGAKGDKGDQGSAGRTYFMETSSSIVKMSADNTIVPNYITLSGYYRDGTATARTAYKCRFKIEETTDGDTYTTVYTSSADETDITHALYSVLASGSSGITASGSSGIGISRNLTALRCTMYAAGGFSQVLDIETIPVAIDVDALTHEDIFNLLTNDGAWQGIYRGSDGKLYINFTYARGGTLNLGGKANTYGNGQMHVYDANDNEIVDINTKGIVVTHYISGMGEKPISYVCITPDVFGGIYLSENKDGTGACAILSPDEIVLKNNSSGPITVQTDITMHMTDESLYLGSVSNYKFHFGKEKSSFYQPVTIGGSLSVAGTKNRIIDTENYDTRKQYCYETATPYFGDIGSGCTDNTGKCYIDINDIFSETVNTGVEYQVFLQKEGQGDIWVEEKTDSYFVVKGTENLKFSWEIKAIQKDYEFERLEKFDNSEKEEVIDYEKEYMEEINDLIKEQEEMLNETVE